MAKSESSSAANADVRIVHVDLGSRAYDVLIGRGLLKRAGELMGATITEPVQIITDETVAPILALRLEQGLNSARYKGGVSFVPAGEESKSIKVASGLLSFLAEKKMPRSATVLALGGGVIGDLAGFVAATYLRGVSFIQVPTTLLAMVDSSVGGKTGVNLPEGKNLVGAFHQPRLVVADLDTLATLPVNQFAAGMAEVIKYGAIRDRSLFKRVAREVTPQDDDLAGIVETCVAIKARIVERDEFETRGERALLNFGHTIGHAIEKATSYTRYLHGEAIAIGMRAAAWLSVWHPETKLPEPDARRIEAALLANHLPTQLDPAVDRAALLTALGNDKKVASDGGNRWVLLKKLGEAQSGLTVASEAVDKVMKLIYSAI